MSNYITHSAQQTKKIARELAVEVLNTGPQTRAVVLALSGNLGAGKTTFTQGFARALGIKEKVLSPTFVVQKRFLLKKKPFKNFFHIDCYRLESKKDLEQLGFKEILKDPENIVLIEWPEKIKKILPKKLISINFEHLEENKRGLTVAF